MDWKPDPALGLISAVVARGTIWWTPDASHPAWLDDNRRQERCVVSGPGETVWLTPAEVDRHRGRGCLRHADGSDPLGQTFRALDPIHNIQGPAYE